MIDVVCVCGAQGRAPDELAGKTVRCKKCGGPIRIAPAASDSYDIAYDLAAPAPAAVAVAPPTMSTAMPAPSRRSSAPERASRSFWTDLPLSFTFVFRPVNLLVFIGALVLGLVNEFMFVPFVWLIPFAALCALYMATITETAGGSDDLPNGSDFDGLVSSLVLPLARFVGVGFTLILFGYLLYAIFAMVAGFESSNTAAYVIASGAAFLWPISMLMVALNGILAMFRVDLMVRSIAAAFVPYLAIWGTVLVALALVVAPSYFLPAKEETDSINPFANAPFRAVMSVAQVYVTLVAMRCIGLFYRHYSDRFPWDGG